MMRVRLNQLECLGILITRFSMPSQKTRGTPVVLLGINQPPSHLHRQLGEALDMPLDGFLDKAARIQIGL